MKWPPRDLFPFKRNCLYCQSSLTSNILSHPELGGFPAATAAETPYDGARVMAFNLFGQGVAFFQSVQTLIAGSQPAEGLSSLRGMTLIAARFEQMSDPEGAGLGIVLRMALNSAREIGADPDLSQQAQRVIQQVGDQLGIAIPDTLPDPESTAIYRSLNDEMRLARSTSEAATRLSASISKLAPSSPASTQNASPTPSPRD